MTSAEERAGDPGPLVVTKIGAQRHNRATVTTPMPTSADVDDITYPGWSVAGCVARQIGRTCLGTVTGDVCSPPDTYRPTRFQRPGQKTVDVDGPPPTGQKHADLSVDMMRSARSHQIVDILNHDLPYIHTVTPERFMASVPAGYRDVIPVVDPIHWKTKGCEARIAAV